MNVPHNGIGASPPLAAYNDNEFRAAAIAAGANVSDNDIEEAEKELILRSLTRKYDPNAVAAAELAGSMKRKVAVENLAALQTYPLAPQNILQALHAITAQMVAMEQRMDARMVAMTANIGAEFRAYLSNNEKV
jgi:hypothetical protein